MIQDFQAKAVAQAEKTIRNRVDKWGVTEPDIKRKANNQIQVQLPGRQDPDEAKQLLGRTAQLEFKIADDDNPVLDALQQKLPRCETMRSAGNSFAMAPREGGCWYAEGIQLPNGGGATRVTFGI